MHQSTANISGVWTNSAPFFQDSRGWLCPAMTNTTPIKNINWVLQNISRSKHNVLRGLHYQTTNPQSKFITLIEGEIQDIIADLRPDSPTYGQFSCYDLSAKKENQIFIPKGCAHGFLVTSEEDALISYLADDVYTPEAEKTLLWNHPDWNFPWKNSSPILSEKDSD